MNNAPKLSLTKQLTKNEKGLKPKKKKPFSLISFLKEHGTLLLCMIIPAALVYLIYFSREIYPLGDGSVLVLDLNGQYVWFFEALRNFAKGDAELLYSFSRAMGGEFLGMYAYYLASPLSFIVCLFPTERMLEGLLTLFLLKTAICGGTFGYYMQKTSKKPRPVAIVVFAVFYAVSSYAIVQQHNTMWIDAMMWLPLISLGIEELIKYGKFRMYTLVLAVTLFSNFYIGYMVCIYCFFYFFLYYLGHDEENRNNPFREKTHFFKSLGRMGFYSLLAVGMALVILISAYYSLSFGKSTFSNTNWVWNTNFDILDLLYKFLPASYDTVRPDGYPFVYCGVLTLLLLPAYFLSKEYPMRQKICSAIFVFLFIASFTLTVTDLLWHAFQRPNWLNYRYSFMLCFYMCVLACRALTALESFPLRTVAGMGGILALLCVMLQKYTDDAYINPNDFTCIWFTLLAIAVYLAVLGVIRTAKHKEIACIALVAVVCIETFLNGLWNMNALDKDVVYTSYSTYNNYLKETRPIVELVQNSDSSFYRMEKTMYRKLNDNMALNIRGLSGSTSTLNQETIMFLQKMGYASQSHWSKYLGGNPVSDSLLGLKYIIADEKHEIYESYYDAHVQSGKYTAFYNPYALSIAFGVSEDLLNFKLGYLPVEEEVEEEKNPDKDKEEEKDISDASAIGDTIDKAKAWLNNLLEIDETVRHAEYTDEFSSPFERLNAIITAMLGADETVQVFVPLDDGNPTVSGLPRPYSAEGHTCYSFEAGSTSGNLTYTVTLPESGEIYYYMPTNYAREVGLTVVNNDTGKTANVGSFGSGESFRIVSLGMHGEGESITLRVKPKGNGLYYITDAPCMYYIDWDVFEEVFASLASDQLIIEDFTESSFKGSLTASRGRELVMTTLAYDSGWKITVDGQEVETVKALGSVVAFYVDGAAGQPHQIEMIYRPNTLVIGTTVTAVSLAVYGFLAIGAPLLSKIPVVRCLVCVPRRRLRANTMKKAKDAKK